MDIRSLFNSCLRTFHGDHSRFQALKFAPGKGALRRLPENSRAKKSRMASGSRARLACHPARFA